VHLCPDCFGTTPDLAIAQCPDCGTELLARVPITASRRVAVPVTFSALAR
jgi:hypothetical protein